MAEGQSHRTPRRVLALTRYSADGPSSRLRFTQFIDPLEPLGFQVALRPFFSDDYLRRLFAGLRPSPIDLLTAYLRRARMLFNQPDHDILWVEKEVFPFLPSVAERLGVGHAPLIVDFDDAIFHRYDRHRHPAVRHVLRHKLDGLLGRAAAVMVGNAYLENYAHQHGARRVVRLPTVVDAARYTPRQHDPSSPLRIGWIGTPANARFLVPIITALQALAARVPLVLVTIGAGELATGAMAHEPHKWSEEREGALLATCDIGIMPLPDTDFERGKCGYKLIQYMAAGLPVIASPVGVNTEIVTADTGFIADTSDDWCRAVDWYASHRGRLPALGKAARERVEARYSLYGAAQLIAAEFNRALSDRLVAGTVVK